MNELKDMLNDWKSGVLAAEDDSVSYNTRDLLHEVWTPRWKFFQPPLWKIFKWAYKIKRTLYKNCYPTGIQDNKNIESVSDKNKVEFQSIPYNTFDEEIKKMIDDHRKHLASIGSRKAIMWPSSLSNFIDVIFSHNEILALWYGSQDDDGYTLLYRGEAWALPEEYSKLTAIKIFGVIADQASETDSINILVEINKDTKFNLPPVHRDEEYEKARRGLSDAEISE